MAKQQGANPITGTIDGFSFYFNKTYGFLVRRKGGPTKKQVKQSREYDIPRRNMAEFGRANHYGKLIRYGFHGLIRHCKESRMYSRLANRLRDIMKMDQESAFGKRDLRKDNMAKFSHFDLDQYNLSKQYFELPIEVQVYNGCLEVTAGISLGKKPGGADAWRLYSVAVSIDFINKNVRADEKQSDIYEFEKGDFAESFTHEVPDETELFYGMCIVWYRYDATIDDYTPLKEEHVNAGFVRYVFR